MIFTKPKCVLIFMLSLILAVSPLHAKKDKKKKKVEEPRVGRVYLKKACILARDYLNDEEPRLASDGAWCLGYVMGFTESQIESMLLINKKKKVRRELGQPGVFFCPDNTTTYLGLIDAIIEHIDATKANKKETISILVRDAWGKAYPCKADPKGKKK